MVHKMRLIHLVVFKKIVGFQLKGKDKKYRAEITHTDLKVRGLLSCPLQLHFQASAGRKMHIFNDKGMKYLNKSVEK